MEYEGDEQPVLNDARQLHSPEQSTVPASLLPSVLSRLGLEYVASAALPGNDEPLAALKDEAISARVAAVRNLGKRRVAGEIELLVAALNDGAWEVRVAAVWALGEFGEQAPLEALMRAAEDEDGSVRAAVLRTLGVRGDRTPIEPLVQALNDSAWQVREIAALTLGDQERPDPTMAIEDGVKISSHEASTLVRFTGQARTFLSRVVRDVAASPVDALPAWADDDVSDAIAGEPGEAGTRRQSARPRTPRLGRVAEGVLAALIIAGIIASWLVIVQRLHPSQGSASSVLLTYRGPTDGPPVWSSDSKYATILTNVSPAGETVLVWNRATGQMTTHILHAPGAHPQENRTVFAPDGRHFAFIDRVTNNQVAVQVWNAIAWRSILITYYSSPSGYLDVLWSPDSARLVITGEDGAIQIWNVVTGRELVTCHVPRIDYLPENVYMSPDGHHVIFGYGLQDTYVLNLTTCKLLTLPSDDAFSTYWSPRGNRFATISIDAGMVQVWDVQTGHNLGSFHVAGSVSHIMWTPDGARIIIAGDSELEVVDVATRRSVLKVMPVSTTLQPVWAWSPDGTRIATLSGASTVQVWDAVTGHKLNAYRSHVKGVRVMIWSPDSYSLAIGSTDGMVEVWVGDKRPETYRGDSSSILYLAWSPDGKSLAAESLDGSERIWQVS